MSNGSNTTATPGPAPGDLQPPTNPDVLARVDRCGLSDREVEKRAGIPQAFISKARKGGSSTGKANPSWLRLRSWLDAYHPEPVRTYVAVAQGPQGPQGTSSNLVDELISRYREAGTPRDYLEADRFLLELAARGEQAGGVDRQVAQTVLEISKEARQKLKYARQEEARIDSRKPITVHVTWRTDWRKKLDDNVKAEAAEEGHDDADL